MLYCFTDARLVDHTITIQLLSPR